MIGQFGRVDWRSLHCVVLLHQEFQIKKGAIQSGKGSDPVTGQRIWNKDSVEQLPPSWDF